MPTHRFSRGAKIREILGIVPYTFSPGVTRAAFHLFPFRYDPAADTITLLGDLTEICGEQGLRTVPQGKSHVLFYEYDGKLYFSTHAGYYNMVDGMERLATVVPEGYKPYPGGHLLSYDLKSSKFKDLGYAPEREAVLSMSMDTRRGVIYGITWKGTASLRYIAPRKH